MSEINLCDHLAALFRVLWSGKWAVVTPYSLLELVWQLIPSFRGYKQQDAQELLCELEDRIRTEVMRLRTKSPTAYPLLVLEAAVGGQLTSMLTCGHCGHVSRGTEPFSDLSLDFPYSGEQSML